jgi:predicted alpha/beta superfamily hydrolase
MMNLKTVDDIQIRCETTNIGAQSETKIQPDFSPVKNPDLIGTLHHFPGVPSQFINPRSVEVWLPPDYDEGDVNGYAVLYMHDGQNLFESQKSFIGVDWGLDETMAALCQKREFRPTIVVGVWNTPQRLREYLPQQPFCDHQSQYLRNRVIKRYGGMPISDNYLRFIVCELKPFVDSRYRTCPEREFTFSMGSSMGGLISLYAICEYPHVFGGAGCLSTHWPIAHRSFSTYLKARLPEPGQHKIYLDYGNEATNAGYRYKQKRVEHIIKRRGYEFGLDWLSRWYAGDPHSETAWRARVRVPLRFLLKNGQQRSEITTLA